MKTTGILSSVIGAAALSLAFAAAPVLRAADHGDAPTLGPDQGCDLADVYAFLDPSNPPDSNNNVILIGTVRGFIVPSEAGNFALFDPTARFTFGIENTGDSKPDLFIDVQFTPRTKASDGTFSQKATVSLRGAVPKAFAGKAGKFDPVEVYQPNLTATPTPQGPFIHDLVNAKNPAPGIKFFAGEADDPFFFDIPGFNRFITSVLGGTRDDTRLDRARDSFAGYNILGISLSVPATLLLDAKAKTGTTPRTQIGVNLVAARGTERTVKGVKVRSGAFTQVDRIGVPGINVAFLPYNDKNSYNGGSTVDDGKGKFYAQIAGTLTALGTSGTSLTTLAAVAGLPSAPPSTPRKKSDPVGTGDFLRLETDKGAKPNDGIGGAGSNANGFPNGRRIADDVIDTVLLLVTNGANVPPPATPARTTGDKVNASDVPPQAVFPFLALPQQPREGSGNIDDNTEN